MKAPKLAKCDIHSLSFCNTKHDSPQCESCILVNHRKEPLYKFINGYKLKRCPHCGEYKMLNEFKLTSNSSGRKYRSWCVECMREYSNVKRVESRKHYMISHKVNGKKAFLQVTSSVQMIKYVRKFMIENNETIIEIKRIK